MNDAVDQLLKSLHLERIRQLLPSELARAQDSAPSYINFLERLLREEHAHRLVKQLEGRLKQAAIPERWALETFPFHRQPGVNKAQILQLAELDFVTGAHNLVLIGPTGVGKTGLGCGLLLKAIENGHRGLFVKAQDLFDEMYASLADRSSRKLINRLMKIELLVIDELGYLNLKPEGRQPTPLRRQGLAPCTPLCWLTITPAVSSTRAWMIWSGGADVARTRAYECFG